jgi:hypothetical protein
MKKDEVLAELEKLNRFVWPIPKVDVLRQVVLLREGYPGDRDRTSQVRFVTKAEFDKSREASRAKTDLQRVSKVSCYTKGCTSPYNKQTLHWCPKCDRTAICATCAANSAQHDKFREDHEQSCTMVPYAVLQQRIAEHVPRKVAPLSVEPPMGQINVGNVDELSERLISLEYRTLDQFDSGRNEPLRRPGAWKLGDKLLEFVTLGKPRRCVTIPGMQALINGAWLHSEEIDFFLSMRKSPEDSRIKIVSTDLSKYLQTGSRQPVQPYQKADLVLIPVVALFTSVESRRLSLVWPGRVPP